MGIIGAIYLGATVPYGVGTLCAGSLTDKLVRFWEAVKPETMEMVMETEMEMKEMVFTAHTCIVKCRCTYALIVLHHASRLQCWLQNYGVFSAT